MQSVLREARFWWTFPIWTFPVPELPEVETVVRSLRPIITGQRIIAAEFLQLRVLRGSPDETSAALAGRRITGVERYGKFIAIRLDRGYLMVHLGMTGRVLVDAEQTKWTHAIFTLERNTVLYDDPRQFGRLEYSLELPARVAKLGPEPLLVTAGEFGLRLKQRKAPVKSVLLNQLVVRGVGNIYADEALFRAGIHPRRVASSLTRPRVLKLYDAMQEVLAEAIESRGSSVSDYVDAQGRKGGFQLLHRVYQRTGEACVNCGAAIKRITLGQRSTHYCPKCQR